MRIIRMGNNNTESLACMSLVLQILEYVAACWDRYKEGQINALDRVQNKAAKFANHTNHSVWETFAERSKIARICALFKAYTCEGAWKAIGGRLQETCYLSRDDDNGKIMGRKQITDIAKYPFVNEIIILCKKFTTEALATFPCKSQVLQYYWSWYIC